MKLLHLAAIALLVPAAAHAQRPDFSALEGRLGGAAQIAGSKRAVFAGTAWGASRDATRRDLIRHGYQQILERNEDGDQIFDGELDGRHAAIVCSYADSLLASVAVLLTPDENRTLDSFYHVVESLSTKYGTANVYEHYESPFERGDGESETAIRANKANITARWKDELHLRATVTQTRRIIVMYEGPAWASESLKRLAKQRRDW